jgi:hypothetical protein
MLKLKTSGRAPSTVQRLVLDAEEVRRPLTVASGSFA